MDGQGSTRNAGLRISVRRGRVVRLPGGLNTSLTGGIYEIWPQTDEERERILALPGVTVLEAGETLRKPKAPKKTDTEV